MNDSMPMPAVEGSGSAALFERVSAPAALALEGLGPWTLVEVADAVGLSYDAVYRDVRRGILSVHAVRRGPGRPRYVVTIVGLRHSARACYRHVPRTSIGALRSRPVEGLDPRSEASRSGAASPPSRSSVLRLAMELMTEDYTRLRD